MKERSGRWAINPAPITEVPTDKSGLVCGVQAKPSKKLPVHLYATKREALAESRKVLRQSIRSLRRYLFLWPPSMLDETRRALDVAQQAVAVPQQALGGS